MKFVIANKSVAIPDSCEFRSRLNECRSRDRIYQESFDAKCLIEHFSHVMLSVQDLHKLNFVLQYSTIQYNAM